MARKKRVFGKLLILGGAAAAGWAIYKNRELLRSFAEALATPPREEDEDLFAEDSAGESEAEASAEAHIGIDNTGAQAEEA